MLLRHPTRAKELSIAELEQAIATIAALRELLPALDKIERAAVRSYKKQREAEAMVPMAWWWAVSREIDIDEQQANEAEEERRVVVEALEKWWGEKWGKKRAMEEEDEYSRNIDDWSMTDDD